MRIEEIDEIMTLEEIDRALILLVDAVELLEKRYRQLDIEIEEATRERAVARAALAELEAS
jgi:hypothetical protein